MFKLFKSKKKNNVVEELTKRVEALEKSVFGKKTISEKTMEKEPITFSQVMDEWLGEEDDNG